MLGLDVPSDKLEAEQSVSSDDDNYKNQPIKVTQDDFDRIKLISQGACKYLLIYGWVRIELLGFSKISHFLGRVLIEHIDMKNSLDSKLQIYSICSIRTRSRK